MRKKRYLLMAMLACALALAPVFAAKEAGPPGSIQTILQGSVMVDYGLIALQDSIEMFANTGKIAFISIDTPIKDTGPYLGPALYGAALSKPHSLVTILGNDNLYQNAPMATPHRGNYLVYFEPRDRLQRLARDQTTGATWGLL